ncbi:hypothetical protein F5146DRAFT_929368 [Armillaria mellea]|nr:hypothetical protein F5146DRAFT_929368 [Armillaria mellea]
MCTQPGFPFGHRGRSRQLSRFFTCFPKKSPSNSDAPTPDPTKTIYVLYPGINDCGRTSSDEFEAIVEALLGAVGGLYIMAGPRNSVLVDIPPIDRSPGGTEQSSSPSQTWSDLLRARPSEFATSTSQATVFVFSSHKLLSDVLGDPLEYDFGENHPDDEGGAIWEDDLHLTPAAHMILADRLLSSLKAEDQ